MTHVSGMMNNVNGLTNAYMHAILKRISIISVLDLSVYNSVLINPISLYARLTGLYYNKLLRKWWIHLPLQMAIHQLPFQNAPCQVLPCHAAKIQIESAAIQSAIRHSLYLKMVLTTQFTIVKLGSQQTPLNLGSEELKASESIELEKIKVSKKWLLMKLHGILCFQNWYTTSSSIAIASIMTTPMPSSTALASWTGTMCHTLCPLQRVCLTQLLHIYSPRLKLVEVHKNKNNTKQFKTKMDENLPSNDWLSSPNTTFLVVDCSSIGRSAPSRFSSAYHDDSISSFSHFLVCQKPMTSFLMFIYDLRWTIKMVSCMPRAYVDRHMVYQYFAQLLVQRLPVYGRGCPT